MKVNEKNLSMALDGNTMLDLYRAFDNHEEWMKEGWVTGESIIWLYWNSETGSVGIDFGKPKGKCKEIASLTYGEVVAGKYQFN